MPIIELFECLQFSTCLRFGVYQDCIHYQRSARVMLDDVNNYDYLYQSYIDHIGGQLCVLLVN